VRHRGAAGVVRRRRPGRPAVPADPPEDAGRAQAGPALPGAAGPWLAPARRPVPAPGGRGPPGSRWVARRGSTAPTPREGERRRRPPAPPRRAVCHRGVVRSIHPIIEDEPDIAAAYAYPAGGCLRVNMVASADGAAWLAGRS